MAIRGRNITAKNKDGEAVDLTGSKSQNFGNVHAFSLIPAGWVTAVIEKVDESTFTMTVKGAENPDMEDGKWTHVRLTPKFRLLNDNASIISKQSFILGAIDSEKNLIAPNPDNDAVWGGVRGARALLQALKLFTADEDGGFELLLHAPAIRNMAVRVRTSIGGYRKGQFDITPSEMLAKLNEHSEATIDFSEARFDADEIAAALAALNAAEGYDEENGYKLKNVITDIQALWAKKAEDEDLFVATRTVDDEEIPTGQIFTNEEAYEAYVNAMYDADLEDGF